MNVFCTKTCQLILHWALNFTAHYSSRKTEGKPYILDCLLLPMEAILDSSFMISCIRQKIDFISELEALGFKVILPREVFQELKDLRLKVNLQDRSAIDIALGLSESKKIKKQTLGKGTVDEGLISLGKRGAYIATLDSAIKRIVPNRIVIKSSRNALEVERN